MYMKKLILAGALGFIILGGANITGGEITKANAASIETDMVTIEGPIVEIGEHDFYIKSQKYNEDFDNLIKVEVDFEHNVKIGDQVKVTGFMWRSFSTYMTATKVEKI